LPKRLFLQKTRSPILDKVVILNSWIDNIFNEPFNFNAIWETIENYNDVISKKSKTLSRLLQFLKWRNLFYWLHLWQLLGKLVGGTKNFDKYFRVFVMITSMNRMRRGRIWSRSENKLFNGRKTTVIFLS
jgi:hypothetical protein